MNDVLVQDLPVTQNLDRSMTSGELTKQAQLIQDILKFVMVENVHYGIIPGTDKPTLYQPGAEKICATFHLAPKQTVEDLSEPHNNFFRYRVACALYTINSGLFVGAAVGEASSAEEKFQWQKAVCDEQWDNTDPTRRRTKYFNDKSDAGFGTIKQIQRNAADLANTILKIASKRAFISATRGATAASDLLEVDLEDETVADVARENRVEQGKAKPKAKAKPAPSFAYGKFKDKQITDSEIPLDYLEYMSNQIATTIQEINADPKHKRAKFKAQDQLFLAALDAEIANRKKTVGSDDKTPQGAAAPDAGDVQTEKTTDSSRKPFTDSSWADTVIYFEEEATAHYATAKKEFGVSSAHELGKDKRIAFYDRVMALVNPPEPEAKK